MDNKTIDNKVACICVTLVWYQDVVERCLSCHLAAATAAHGLRKTNANEMQILVLSVCCTHTPAGHYCTHRCSSDEKIFEEGNCWKIAEKTETWALIYPLTSLSHGVRIPGCLCGEGRWDNIGDVVHYYSLSEVKEGNECPIHYTLNWSDEVLQSGPISCYCYTSDSLHVC